MDYDPPPHLPAEEAWIPYLICRFQTEHLIEMWFWVLPQRSGRCHQVQNTLKATAQDEPRELDGEKGGEGGLSSGGDSPVPSPPQPPTPLLPPPKLPGSQPDLKAQGAMTGSGWARCFRGPGQDMHLRSSPGSIRY